jgi:uncharacterized membrane protein
MTSSSDTVASEKNLKTLTHAVYALQALGFLVAITWIVAVVIDYVKLDETKGTWLESHFRWQIRTFWWGLLWGALGVITFVIIVGWLILVADAIWIIYRIVKGWLYLNDGKPIT